MNDRSDSLRSVIATVESTESTIRNVLEILQRPNRALEAGIKDALARESEPSADNAPAPATILAEEAQRVAALHALLQLPRSLEQQLAEAAAATERANAAALEALSSSFARAEMERSKAAGGGGWGAGLAADAAASVAAEARAQEAGRDKAMRALAIAPTSAVNIFAADVSRAARRTATVAAATHRACFGDSSIASGAGAAAADGTSASAVVSSLERMAKLSQATLARGDEYLSGGSGSSSAGSGGHRRKGGGSESKSIGEGVNSEGEDTHSFLPALARELQDMWSMAPISEEGQKVLTDVAAGFEELAPIRTKSGGKKERKRKKEKKRKGKGKDRDKDRDRMDVEPTAVIGGAAATVPVTTEQPDGAVFTAPVFESNGLLKKLAGDRRHLRQRVDVVSAAVAKLVEGMLLVVDERLGGAVKHYRPPCLAFFYTVSLLFLTRLLMHKRS